MLYTLFEGNHTPRLNWRHGCSNSRPIRSHFLAEAESFLRTSSRFSRRRRWQRNPARYANDTRAPDYDQQCSMAPRA